MGIVQWWRDRRVLKEARAAEYATYSYRLEKAAGISSVILVCHQDTWAFMDRWASAGANDKWKPPQVKEVPGRADQMVEVRLSGPQLVTVLDQMAGMARVSYSIQRYPVPDRAIARRVYKAIGSVVDLVDPDAVTTTAVPPIVIDDQSTTGSPGRTDEARP